MSHYTPLPLPNSYHIEEYGLFGPVVDGLLIAQKIVIDQHIEDAYDEAPILRQIDRCIQEAKVAYSKGVPR